jgi:hypothetical protein
MDGNSVLHFDGTRFEDLKQVSMSALKILKDVGELAGDRIGIKSQDPVDDMVRPGLVGRIEIARFGRWLERPHDHSGGVGAQIQGLTIQEWEL